MTNFQTDEFIQQEDDTQKGKFLTFSLGNEFYGIEIRYVTEIVGIQSITEVPEFPKHIKGVINLRGKIIPIMDVRLMFNKKSRDYDDRTCIVVVDMKDIPIGLVVDRVSEVLSIDEQNISDLPNFSKNYESRYIKGIGKVGSEVKLLLNCEELLKTEDKESIKEKI